MKITQEIQKRSEEIQSTLANMAHNSYMKSNSEYQDCMNVAIFTKLAELELQIESLIKLQQSSNQAIVDFYLPKEQSK